MVVVLNGLTGTEVLHTTLWSIMPTGDFVQRDERTGNFFFSAHYSNTLTPLFHSHSMQKIFFSMGTCLLLLTS